MAGRAFFAWPKAVAASTHRRKAPTGPRSANIRKFESTEGEPEIIAERALEGKLASGGRCRTRPQSGRRRWRSSWNVATKNATGSTSHPPRPADSPGFREMNWCPREESNPRPSHYKCAALPTELQGRRRQAEARGETRAGPCKEPDSRSALIISESGPTEIEADGAPLGEVTLQRHNPDTPTATQTTCLKHSPQISPPRSPS